MHLTAIPIVVGLCTMAWLATYSEGLHKEMAGRFKKNWNIVEKKF